MKNIILIALLFLCSVIPASAQIIRNGDESYSPGAWIATLMPNAASTGTTVNKIAKLTGTGTVVITATTDVIGFVGIVGAGAGTTGSASIVISGQVACVFDGATTANDYVVNSVSVAGDCSDGGSTLPSVQSLGRVLSTNGSGGTYQVIVNPHAGTITVSSGTANLGTTIITSGNCASTVSVTATGVLTTDTIISTPGANWSAATGYSGVGTVLTIYPYPTANNVNYTVCNWTGSSVTPSAVTINWSVKR